VGLAQAIPVIVLALPAGQLADRYDRRSIVRACLLLSAVASVGLAVVSLKDWGVGYMYALLSVGAVGQAIGWPARSSLLPQIVPADVFNNAVTWNSSFFQIALMAGPGAGGLILAYFSAPLAYLLDAACVMVFFALLGGLRLRPVERQREPITLQSLAAGVRFVWRSKILLATITLDLFAVLLGGSIALVPAVATKILGVGPVGFGWLKASPALGAFAAALLLAHLPPMRKAGRAMLWSVAGFGAATVVFGLSKSYWLSFVALGLTGAFDNVSVVVRHTLVQMLPPDHMRGRVSAVNNVFIGASNELGAFESGLAARLLGTARSIVFGGVGTILVVLGVALRWPEVREFGSLKDARPIDETPDEPRGFDVVATKPG
jgi:MFS family permease